MNNDLTTGNPKKVLWLFCMPLFASVIFQQLYNIADSFVAGRFIGENALAAVGNSYEITLIFIAFAFGCNMGCSVVVSQFFGAKEYENLKTTISTSFISTGLLCVLLMAGGILGGESLLRLINTPENIFADSILYLDIYVLGLPFVFFYNISNGIFSALGDSKTPFVFLAVSSVSNIIMDIFFVRFLKMGVSGVAWATFICQGISCVISVLVVVNRLKKIPVTKEYKLFDKFIFIKILKIAVPSAMQQSFISVGNIIIQGVINTFGSAVIAGYSAAIKLNNLVVSSFTTLGNGISNYTAQNLGAGKTDRIREGFKVGLKMVWIICVPIVLFYLIGGKYLVLTFMDNPSKEALDSGLLFLKIVAPFYFVIAGKLVTDGILRGSGLMKQFMAATFTDLLLRVFLAFVLSRTVLSYTGIWCAWPIGWFVGAIISIYFYRKAFFGAKGV